MIFIEISIKEHVKLVTLTKLNKIMIKLLIYIEVPI